MLAVVTIASPNRVTTHTAQPDPEQPVVCGGRLARRALRGVATMLILALAAALTAALGVVVVSYAGALADPAPDPISVRTVDWIRDHGGGPVINTLENWWYTPRHHATPAPALSPPGAGAPGAPAALAALGPYSDPGEGRWQAGPTSAKGTPALYATYVRPDPADPNVIAGIARFDQRLVATRLIAGTKEPDRRTWPENGEVPAELLSSLVATFNSGFKMSDAQGGYFAQGHTAAPLRRGAASLVIDDTGRASVGAWGQDIQPGPRIAAVRQNLSLIVDHSGPVSDLDVNADNRWGSAKNQLQYTWRSGIGVDPAGDLYYVAGDQLTLKTLARVRGHEKVPAGGQLGVPAGGQV